MDKPQAAGDLYQLHCHALGVTLYCQLVTPCARLLEAMLSGWSLQSISNYGDAIDLQVKGEDRYAVKSDVVAFYAEHKDLVSTFNELLICIAYLVCHQRPDLLLIHAGAMLELQPDGKFTNVLLLGGHKAGKSTYLATNCQQANHFVSDDLLWVNEAGQLLGLGFPLRLRRPISEDVISLYGAKQLLAGHSLAYISPKALPIYPAGEELHVDRVLLLEDYVANEVPRQQWLALIEQRIVAIPEIEQQ